MFQGVSAIAVAGVALVGLNAWRRQLQTTRHQALAEEALSLVFRMRDAIRHMRDPMALTSEMDKVERRQNETDIDFERRKHFGVVEVRYRLYAESATQLESLRYRVQAVLGEEALASVEAVIAVLLRVRTEASKAVHRQSMLFKYEALVQRSPSDQNTTNLDDAQRKFNESESWAQSGTEGDDPAAAALKAAVESAEAALKNFAMMKPQR